MDFMQYEGETQFLGISNRDLRAHNMNIERRSSRFMRLSCLRNFDPSELQDNEEELHDDPKPTFKEPKPLNSKVTTSASVNDRLEKLRKWKAEKELRKKLELNNSKAPFVVSHGLLKPGVSKLPQFPRPYLNTSRIATMANKVAIPAPKSLDKQGAIPKKTIPPRGFSRPPNPVAPPKVMAPAAKPIPKNKPLPSVPTVKKLITPNNQMTKPAAKTFAPSIRAPAQFGFKSGTTRTRVAPPVKSQLPEAKTKNPTTAKPGSTKTPQDAFQKSKSKTFPVMSPKTTSLNKEAPEMTRKTNAKSSEAANLSFAPANFKFRPNFSFQKIVFPNGVPKAPKKSLKLEEFSLSNVKPTKAIPDIVGAGPSFEEKKVNNDDIGFKFPPSPVTTTAHEKSIPMKDFSEQQPILSKESDDEPPSPKPDETNSFGSGLLVAKKEKETLDNTKCTAARKVDDYDEYDLMKETMPSYDLPEFDSPRRSRRLAGRISSSILKDKSETALDNVLNTDIAGMFTSLKLANPSTLVTNTTPKNRRANRLTMAKENSDSNLDAIGEDTDSEMTFKNRPSTLYTDTPNRPITRSQHRKLSLLGSPQVPHQGPRKSIKGDLITFSPLL